MTKVISSACASEARHQSVQKYLLTSKTMCGSPRCFLSELEEEIRAATMRLEEAGFHGYCCHVSGY